MEESRNAARMKRLLFFGRRLRLIGKSLHRTFSEPCLPECVRQVVSEKPQKIGGSHLPKGHSHFFLCSCRACACQVRPRLFPLRESSTNAVTLQFDCRSLRLQKLLQLLGLHHVSINLQNKNNGLHRSCPPTTGKEGQYLPVLGPPCGFLRTKNTKTNIRCEQYASFG